MTRIFRLLTIALISLVIGQGGARAQSSAEVQDKLRSLLASLQSSTGNFLAGQEALGRLDTDSASSFLSTASTNEPDNPLLVVRAFHAQAANGQIEDAAKTARILQEIAPQDDLSRLVIGTVALKQRQYNEAIAVLDGVDPHSVVGITAAVVKAWADVGDNHYDRAVEMMDSLAGSGIDDFLIYHRALLADVADQRDEALDLAETAYEAEPFDMRFVATYARMLANRSRFEEAEAIVTKYREQGLDDPSVLALEDDLKAGRRPGKLAPTAQAGAAEIFNSLGGALARDGGVDLATIYLRMALYLVPSLDLASMELGRLYDDNGQPDMADALYTSMSKDSPYWQKAEVRMIHNFADANGDEKAVARLNDILAKEPENLDAIVALGDLLRSDEKFAEAADAYTRVLELLGGGHPQDWRFYYLRGMCYERAKNWTPAEADFLAALKLNPNNPQVLNYLGYSWIDQGTHLDEALEMIKKALEWDPTDGYVVDSLGWAYYRLGRYDEAVQTLEQAVQLRASDAAINDHLGDAYWQAGRKLEARFQWTIASDLDPDSEIGEAARDKLDNGLEAAGAVAANG